MPYATLISTEDLAQHLDDPNWAIIDARFSLAETELGRSEYESSHISGAIYAHLDDDLSGPITPGETSRHPLPDIASFAQTLSNWGIDDQTQVIVYDSMNGAIAARLWWMLRWLGHEAVAVLDGGWPLWEDENRPTKSGIEQREPRSFRPNPNPDQLVDVSEVATISQNQTALLVDCRARPRYLGEVEPLDPVAGHIPNAVNAPMTENLAEDGRFLPPTKLRDRFYNLLNDRDPEEVVFYCGSGVTAAHNVLAMTHIGLDGSRMYAGSWSEWITDPSRPVETG